MNNEILKTGIILFLLSFVCIIDIGCNKSEIISPIEEEHQWQKMKGPYAGNISSILIGSTNQILVGTINLGTYQTIDNAVTWSKTSLSSISWIVSFAKSPNGMYFAGLYQGEVFRKKDLYDHWEQTSYLQNGQAVRGIVINSKGIIFIGGDDGVFKSMDNGNTWMEARSGLVQNNAGTIAINSNDQLFLAQSNSLFFSSDDGKNWSNINSDFTYDFISEILVVDTSQILIGTSEGVFRSTNNGKTLLQIGSINAFVSSLVMDKQKNIYTSTDEGLFKLPPSADDWIFITNEVNLSKLALDSYNNLLACTERHGLLRSIDYGLTWNTIGIPVGDVSELSISPMGDVFATVKSSGLYKYNPVSDNWINLFYVYPATSHNINTTGEIFIGNYPAVFRSNDGGNTWQVHWMTKTYYYSILSFGFSNNRTIFAGTDGDGIYRSDDNGSSWLKINFGLRGMQIRAITVAPSSEIFIATDLGIYISENYGESWELISSLYLNTSSILLLPNGAMIAGTIDNGIYKSTEDRKKWMPINNGLTDLRIKKNIFTRTGDIISVTSSKVFISSNYGNLWTDISEGLPPTPFTTILEDMSGNFILGTDGAGCYKMKKE